MKITNIERVAKVADIDYCLYTDTDSVFYEAMPLIQRKRSDFKEEEIPATLATR